MKPTINKPAGVARKPPAAINHIAIVCFVKIFSKLLHSKLIFLTISLFVFYFYRMRSQI